MSWQASNGLEGGGAREDTYADLLISSEQPERKLCFGFFEGRSAIVRFAWEETLAFL
jgi:hypothetical protein